MSTISNPTGKPYYPTLDGWRAIAVSLVIGAHAVPMLNNQGGSLARLVASALSHAGIGVDIFFAISGFLICSLLLNEKEKNGGISLKGFYTRRFFRIIPPIAFYLTTLYFLNLFDQIKNVTPNEILGSLFFYRNYVSEGSWYTGHFWTLAVEEHFYLFSPLILAFLPWRKSILMVVGLAILCAGIRWWESTYFSAGYSNLEFRTENRLDGLMYGAILAHLVYSKKWGSHLRTLIQPKALICILLIYIVATVAIQSMPFRRTISAIVIPLLICHTVLQPQQTIGKILELKWITWIGRLSYSLYIWQMLFLVRGVRDLPLLQSFPWAFVAILICASLSYYLLEKPMINIGRKLSARL